MERESIKESTPDARLRSLVAPVIYGDVFDFPLTLGELHRYCPLAMTREELGNELREDERFGQAVHHEEDLYFLEGRRELVELRRVRREASEKAWRLARRVMRLIGYVPFIRGVLVTGSLAVGNARPGDDLDFLVLTAPKRLWFVFGALGVLQRICSRRYLCSNYYISVDHLRLRRESFYLAREVVQARPIFGSEACRSFQEENRWAFDQFPNAGFECPGEDPVIERRGLLGWITRCVEWPLGGRLGDAVERLMKRFLKRRLFAHYGKYGHEVPEDVLRYALDEVELRFHGLDHENTIYQAFQTREERLEPILNSRP